MDALCFDMLGAIKQISNGGVMSKTAEAPARPAGKEKKGPKKTVLLENGIRLVMQESHRLAEVLAKHQEELEDRKAKIAVGLQDLLRQMKEDRLEAVTAKAPSGQGYKFAPPEEKEEALKITKIKVPADA